MYEKLYHTMVEQIVLQVVGVEDYNNIKKHLESKGFRLVETTKPYELSNIVIMTFQKETDAITINKDK